MDGWKLWFIIGYAESPLKGQMKIRSIQIKAKYSVTVEWQRVLLNYFVQGYSHGCPDYHIDPVLLGDCELFPPFLIKVLVPNYPVEEERHF